MHGERVSIGVEAAQSGRPSTHAQRITCLSIGGRDSIAGLLIGGCR